MGCHPISLAASPLTLSPRSHVLRHLDSALPRPRRVLSHVPFRDDVPELKDISAPAEHHRHHHHQRIPDSQSLDELKDNLGVGSFDGDGDGDSNGDGDGDGDGVVYGYSDAMVDEMISLCLQHGLEKFDVTFAVRACDVLHSVEALKRLLSHSKLWSLTLWCGAEGMNYDCGDGVRYPS